MKYITVRAHTCIPWIVTQVRAKATPIVWWLRNKNTSLRVILVDKSRHNVTVFIIYPECANLFKFCMHSITIKYLGTVCVRVLSFSRVSSRVVSQTDKSVWRGIHPSHTTPQLPYPRPPPPPSAPYCCPNYSLFTRTNFDKFNIVPTPLCETGFPCRCGRAVRPLVSSTRTTLMLYINIKV